MSTKLERLTETRRKQRDSRSKKREKEGSTGFRQSCRIGVRPLFATKRLWGVGVWLRDAGRGPWEDCQNCQNWIIAKI